MGQLGVVDPQNFHAKFTTLWYNRKNGWGKKDDELWTLRTAENSLRNNGIFDAGETFSAGVGSLGRLQPCLWQGRIPVFQYRPLFCRSCRNRENDIAGLPVRNWIEISVCIGFTTTSARLNWYEVSFWSQLCFSNHAKSLTLLSGVADWQSKENVVYSLM